MIPAPFLGLGVVSIAHKGNTFGFGWLGGNGGKTVMSIGKYGSIADFTFDYYSFSSSSDFTGTLVKSQAVPNPELDLIERPVMLDDQMAAMLGVKFTLVSQTGGSYGTLTLSSDMTMGAWSKVVVGGVRGRQITLSFNTSVGGAQATANYHYSVGFFDGTNAPAASLDANDPNGITLYSIQNGMAHI